MKPIDLNALIEKVTELLVTSGLLKMCTIIRDYLEGLPQVLGDEMLIEQLLTNIEINAAHAMSNHGILTLRTKLSESTSSVEFSITDTGHGIPDDKRHQIFLPFFTTKEKGKGTGLGMYIVKQVVDQHKGYIHIDSKVGAGTTVTIGLPAKRG
jgi:signal transduction histidine kinase